MPPPLSSGSGNAVTAGAQVGAEPAAHLAATAHHHGLALLAAGGAIHQARLQLDRVVDEQAGHGVAQLGIHPARRAARAQALEHLRLHGKVAHGQAAGALDAAELGGGVEAAGHGGEDLLVAAGDLGAQGVQAGGVGIHGVSFRLATGAGPY